MSDKVAFLEDGRTVLRISGSTTPPPGSTCFSSPEEMAVALDRESMDAARKSMLNSDAAISSSDAGTAAKLLWATIMELVPGMGATLPRKLSRTTDAFGNPRNPDRSKLELICLAYVPGQDRMQDFFYKRLSKQEKAILAILVKDGRGIWTSDQMEELMVAKASELATVQDPLTVFKYYRGSLLERRFLRRVSYEEFAKKYRGVSLV